VTWDWKSDLPLLGSDKYKKKNIKNLDPQLGLNHRFRLAYDHVWKLIINLENMFLKVFQQYFEGILLKFQQNPVRCSVN
jgi:hypothetical protein